MCQDKFGHVGWFMITFCNSVCIKSTNYLETISHARFQKIWVIIWYFYQHFIFYVILHSYNLFISIVH